MIRCPRGKGQERQKYVAFMSATNGSTMAPEVLERGEERLR